MPAMPPTTKVAPCPDCGVPTPYRTAKTRCPACKQENRRRLYREAAYTQRRKNGIEEVKGVAVKCDNCPAIIIRRTRTHRLCEACAPGEALLRARVARDRLSREQGRPLIDRIRQCQHCGAEFTSEQVPSVYCEPCRDLSTAGKLPHLREATAKWQRNQLATVPAFGINARMRTAVGKALRGEKSRRAWESLVGYTTEDLMRHIERGFLKGMTWENRDRWAIDHIRPLAQFTYTSAEDPEFREAWALSNLRPIWSVDNSSKRDKRLFLI